LRAERRLGELLAALPKQDGGDAARARSQAASEVPARLDELGISKRQSSRCQTIAAVPEPVFEEYVTVVREQGRVDGKTELTTTGALLVAHLFSLPEDVVADPFARRGTTAAVAAHLGVSPGPATATQPVSQPHEPGLLASNHGQPENTAAMCGRHDLSL
jgi:hypothetical protein